ncbi:hypothetical protein K1T71_014201 [Dendrolimus kikuchii]|uniref:Uncharacterized protein n=1 Tax=Dendrolimus kikuchii TaxID=765133 RepID=A0ACC1CFB9_9NEOP|nr:hypothetical protein K1T71_014201 [Dendrolimus kikuchii]
MNFIGLAFLLVAAFTQTTQAQCYRSCGCAPSFAVPAAITSVPGTTIIQTPSVANTLADTLSLLTVSSLLADTLPFSCGSMLSAVTNVNQPPLVLNTLLVKLAFLSTVYKLNCYYR